MIEIKVDPERLASAGSSSPQDFGKGGCSSWWLALPYEVEAIPFCFPPNATGNASCVPAPKPEPPAPAHDPHADPECSTCGHVASDHRPGSCDPRRDDDLRLAAYIDQTEQLRQRDAAHAERIRELEERVADLEGKLKEAVSRGVNGGFLATERTTWAEQESELRAYIAHQESSIQGMANALAASMEQQVELTVERSALEAQLATAREGALREAVAVVQGEADKLVAGAREAAQRGDQTARLDHLACASAVRMCAAAVEQLLTSPPPRVDAQIPMSREKAHDFDRLEYAFQTRERAVQASRAAHGTDETPKTSHALRVAIRNLDLLLEELQHKAIKAMRPLPAPPSQPDDEQGDNA